MDKRLAQLLGMVAGLQREVRALRASVSGRVNARELQADDMSVGEFAAAVGRSADWVYDQIRRRRVRVLPLGKPYRIARAEVIRLRKGGEA